MMNRYNRVHAFLLLLAMSFFHWVHAQDSTTQKLDELMRAYHKVDKFNGSILIASKGKLLLDKGYGYRDVKSHALNDANSIYQIYSITKTFTSTVILMLVEQGKLRLDDKLSKFYPDFPKGDSITIENLLTHTSGIYDYTHGNDMKDESEPNMIRFLTSKPLDFSPGTSWSYSNSGYFLLGFIIQKITGMRYEDAVTKMIFRPVKMIHSGFDFKNLSSPHKTTPYAVLAKDSAATAIIYDAPGPFAAGAIYSTVGDLYLYHKAHQQYALVSEALMKKAYTSFKAGYGYGWIVNQFDGHDLVSHSGGAAGYRSNFARIIKDDIAIILLSNTENCNPTQITNNIIMLLDHKPYFLPKEIPVSSTLMKSYEGYYEVNPGLKLRVWMELGRLSAQSTQGPPTGLLAEREDYFYSEEANAYLLFKKGKDGRVDEMQIEKGSLTLVGKRYMPSWGLVGSATAKGWVDSIPDIAMTEDSLHKGTWSIRNISLSGGELKFRFNNDWNRNYGDNDNDGIADESGKNIPVEQGTYDIILNLEDQKSFKYTIRKKL